MSLFVITCIASSLQDSGALLALLCTGVSHPIPSSFSRGVSVCWDEELVCWPPLIRFKFGCASGPA